MAHTHKIGDIVVPTIGPHKGHPHTVIHVHSTGEVNIKPKGLTGTRNKYRMGAVTAQPHHLETKTVKESSACPDCGCDPCKCKVKLTEELKPIHKGSHQYVGKINGKTYVVPHAEYSSFEPEYKKPLPHKTVTSREHIAKHNTNMTPSEIDTIHQHIQQVHKESVDEDYTAMKGKESFMKKKPVDVKYDPRWHVMPHGKTLERPTKEEVELGEAKLKDACWKGYEAIGMKEKSGKKVPNCVPVNEQTPSGGFGGPETAGVTSGGDVSTKTVSGSDTSSKGTRKQEILSRAMKSAKEKQKQKLGGKSEFEKDPEYRPLVVTQP